MCLNICKGMWIYLGGVVQTLPDNKIDSDPSNGQVQNKFTTKATDIINASTDLEHGVTFEKKYIIS